MKRELLILVSKHDLLWNEFILFATKEFGTAKMNEIIKKVNHSKIVAKFLNEAKINILTFSGGEFLACIHSSISFTFSKSETISIAGVILLKKWNYEIGQPNFISDDVYLNEVFFSILDRCDRFKTHTKSAPNFFERFNDFFVKKFKLQYFENRNVVVRKDVTFDAVLCNAIKSELKTEFRVIDNLDEINLVPNECEIIRLDNNKGAIFSTSFLDESILIPFPFLFNSDINVYNSSNPSTIDCKIRITSYSIERFRKDYEYDVRDEGFSAYEEEIDELNRLHPTLNAEYFLFDDHYSKVLDIPAYRNVWVWVFSFKINMTTSPSIINGPTFELITPEMWDIILKDL